MRILAQQTSSLISGGTLTLADDLLISNTGGSTTSAGAIQISVRLPGTGNLTFSKCEHRDKFAVFPERYGIQTASNTFVG